MQTASNHKGWALYMDIGPNTPLLNNPNTRLVPGGIDYMDIGPSTPLLNNPNARRVPGGRLTKAVTLSPPHLYDFLKVFEKVDELLVPVVRGQPSPVLLLVLVHEPVQRDLVVGKAAEEGIDSPGTVLLGV